MYFLHTISLANGVDTYVRIAHINSVTVVEQSIEFSLHNRIAFWRIVQTTQTHVKIICTYTWKHFSKKKQLKPISDIETILNLKIAMVYLRLKTKTAPG